MAIKDILIRQNLIVNLITRRKRITLEEILNAIYEEGKYISCKLDISTRTLQRDFIDIKTIYALEIKYDRRTKEYFIHEEYNPEINQRIIESLDYLQFLKFDNSILDCVQVEAREIGGRENLRPLIQAIKNKKNVDFTYTKFNGDISNRHLSPLALKEYRNRWYIICEDANIIKSFALDRISELKISNESFSSEIGFDIKAHFKDSFGIDGPKSTFPEEIILKFNHFQGMYIKSMKLHPSQEIIEENKEYLKVKLKIHITNDFIIELLSLGGNVEVISPVSLRERMQERLKEAYLQYQ
ncbi:helix-turn-helix transcriptional regulator [Ancylomarina sp. YFZ004]